MPDEDYTEVALWSAKVGTTKVTSMNELVADYLVFGDMYQQVSIILNGCSEANGGH